MSRRIADCPEVCKHNIGVKIANLVKYLARTRLARFVLLEIKMACCSDAGTAEYPFNLDLDVRQVTTPSAECNRWVNRGLGWLFGFHFEEAVRCFEKAIDKDDKCLFVRQRTASKHIYMNHTCKHC